MKKNFLKTTMLAVLAMFSANTFAQLEFDGLSVAPGATQTVSVYYTVAEKAQDMCTLQFRVYDLPEGVTIENAQLNKEVFTNSTAESSATPNAKKGFTMMVWDNGAAFGATISDGVKTLIGTFDVVAAESVAKNDYTLRLEQIKMVADASTGSSTEKLDNQTITLSVTDATGINEVSAQVENAPIYSIAGARMNGNLQKGIYVQNGKKFIVK